MPYHPSRSLELLRLGTQNPSAEFRDGQEEAIRYIVEGLGRLLVVQKTGWGKSSVYFIATKLLREQGLGPAILISPLLALMRNQIAAAERMGVRALTIHSGNTGEWDEVKERVQRVEVDILLISPERLSNEYFRNEVLGPVAGSISLLVVDEAHCISDWGHDFRPATDGQGECHHGPDRQGAASNESRIACRRREGGHEMETDSERAVGRVLESRREAHFIAA